MGVVLLAPACGLVPRVPPVASAPGSRVGAPGFSFASDTFAFANLIRARQPDVPDLYANYCFVMARSLRQFFRFARFDPEAPPLDHAGYVRRVRLVVARPPWASAPPPDDRVVIPGYANLREFSRAEEAAIKEGLGPRFLTLVHWTNWRVTFPVSRAHQQRVAEEIEAELGAGRLAQLLVTNWPKPELNHTLVAFEYRERGEAVEFIVWDPNDPAEPGTITFDRVALRFWATHVYDTAPGPIRVFRMYYSRFL